MSTLYIAFMFVGMNKPLLLFILDRVFFGGRR